LARIFLFHVRSVNKRGAADVVERVPKVSLLTLGVGARVIKGFVIQFPTGPVWNSRSDEKRLRLGKLHEVV
jgi:hypothetical protein